MFSYYYNFLSVKVEGRRRKCTNVCMFVSMYVYENVSVHVFVCVREKEAVCVFVYEEKRI